MTKYTEPVIVPSSYSLNLDERFLIVCSWIVEISS